MPVKLLLHGWTLAKGPMIRLLPQHSGFLAGHRTAPHLAFTGENNPSNEWGAIATVMDRH